MPTTKTKITKNTPYNNPLNWLLLGPIGVGFLTQAVAAFSRQAAAITLVLELPAAVAIIYLYVTQVRYFKQWYPAKQLSRQWLMMAMSFIGPLVGVYLGDYSGATTYGTKGDGFGSNTLTGLGIGVAIVAIFFYVITIGNAWFIAANGRERAVRIVGRVFYVIGYVVIAATSWFAYQIIFTSHDPSSE